MKANQLKHKFSPNQNKIGHGGKRSMRKKSNNGKKRKLRQKYAKARKEKIKNGSLLRVFLTDILSTNEAREKS